MQHNPAYTAPFPRTKLSMHVEFICAHWHQPTLRDRSDIGPRVDAAQIMARAFGSHRPLFPLARKGVKR